MNTSNSDQPSRFAGFTADPSSTLPVPVQKALFVARVLQQRAAELQTPQEHRQQAELDRMLQNPQDKSTLTQMTDQAFRSKAPHRAVDQFIHILDVQGVPRFFSPLDRTLLKGFQSFGGYLPAVAVPLVKDRLRHETANVILPAETEMLAGHLRERRAAGVRMNVNYLGEAILGEAEARRRLEIYLHALQQPEIEVVSVKISTLYSQISALAHEHGVRTLCDRLELLYRAAAHSTFTRGDGITVSKFVYLDMEEYRDLSITADAFMRTLDRRGLERVNAGIALQAYVPDSFRTQKRLNDWAKERLRKGGAPITIRVVKGANMEMERVEASLRGWPQAPYTSKVETDANYKRMVQEGMENLDAVRLGIASHNLFDLAYGLVLAADANALDQVQFEMLEGMANHQRRALFEVTRNLLLYAPVCRKEDFIHAIGYLIRRLDENTGPDNFLRHAFQISVGSPEWQRLEEGFIRAFEQVPTVREGSRRTQNRLASPVAVSRCGSDWPRFVNEPDTDFSLPQNIDWAKEIIARWESRCGTNAVEIPLVIAGDTILERTPAQPETPNSKPGTRRTVRDCLDPSRPGTIIARYPQATSDDIERAVSCAAADEDGWRTLSPAERYEVFGRIAQELREARGDLIGAAIANGGKTILEADPEVSEAIDFVEFYSSTARWFQELATVESGGKGVVVVVSPWNFPIAIPCGGIAAALAAGNTVLLKPASDAVLIAYELCQCFWRAGISRKTLQFVPCSGGREGQQLVTHPKVNSVILTGGTSTALTMLKAKPDLNLHAETGGKNATIVTALADRDQAIKHVLHSGFSHSGQKCSATSLLLLEGEVYDDPEFKKTLCDAVESMLVGSAWDLKTRMGPLIRPPSDDLERGLKVLEPGESWAVLPRQVGESPNLWSPGVKWGVRPGSYTHLTEFFGPVLGVMRFEKLSEAIALVNQTGYGLTSGIETLDDREQEIWKEGIRAGNLYINRSTTGAIVLRQPFGGMGKSAFGPGIKAGGPNYVAQFMSFSDRESSNGERGSKELDSQDQRLEVLRHNLNKLLEESSEQTRPEITKTLAALVRYCRAMREEFGLEHDHFQLVGQDNFRRYLPVRWLRIRVHADDSFFDVVARVCAARVAGCRITVSVPEGLEHPAVKVLEERLTATWAAAIEFVPESDEELAEAIRAGQTERIRYAAPERVSQVIHAAAAETGLCIVSTPVLAEGRIELLWHTEEQSISNDYHRYGNLGPRAAQLRAPIS